VLVILIFSNCPRKGDFPVLKGPYLGQKPPGTTPQIFAPGIVSKGENEILAIPSPDGKEFFYSTKDSTHPLTVMHTKQKNGIWTRPQVASFSGKYYNGAVGISYGGSKLYLNSLRPEKEGDEPLECQNIWEVERKGDDWGNPRMLPPPINSDKRDLGASLTKDGTIYFNTTREGVQGGGCRSKWINGKYSEIENIQELLNIEMPVIEIDIDPDENFMVFVSFNQEDSYGGFDLYVSFNKGNDQWTKPLNMGNRINTSANEHFPTLSPDGQRIYFGSDRPLTGGEKPLK